MANEYALLTLSIKYDIMKLMKQFSQHSTNPRERRAFAHTLRDNALKTGEPLDKVLALEASISASGASKGKNLGKHALNAFRSTNGTKLIPEPSEFKTPHQHSTFSNEIYSRAMTTVAEIEGNEHGVSVDAHKPNGINEYVGAFRRLDAHSTRNSAGMQKQSFDGRSQPADTPRSEATIQNGAAHNLDRGAHIVEVTTTHSTGNFYRTVEAVTSQHNTPQ